MYYFDLRRSGGGKKNGESVTISALTSVWDKLYSGGKDFPVLATYTGEGLVIRYARSGNNVRLEGRPENGYWKRKVTFPCGKYRLWNLPIGRYPAEYDGLNECFRITFPKQEEEPEQLSLF